jgi:DNA-binding YbaB/EbfC family protein
MDVSNLFGKVKEVQERMKAVQNALAQVSLEGEAGAGMVKAVVNGQRKLQKIEVEEATYSDKELTLDLIVAAVNHAMEKADEHAKNEIKKSTEGLMPNIPGFEFK